jgi:hypothetical protein
MGVGSTSTKHAAITDAIDAHVESEQGKGGDDGGASGAVEHAGLTGTAIMLGSLLGHGDHPAAAAQSSARARAALIQGILSLL